MRDNEDRLGALPTEDAPMMNMPVQAENKPLSFVAPTEFVDLPSRGTLYPEGHPLKDRKSIEIRFMTAKEEDILTSRSLIKKGVAIDRMLESLIVDKNIKVDQLLLGDKNALIIAARISGYGGSYRTTVTCPACGTTGKHEFDLNNLSHHVCSDWEKFGVTLTPKNTFSFSLPKSGAVVEVRPLFGVDELNLAEVMEKKKKMNLPEETTTTQMKSYVVSVNGNKDKAFIRQFVENMPALDSRTMRLLYKEIIPNVDMNQNFTCSSCAYEQDMEVPFTVEFFWPK